MCADTWMSALTIRRNKVHIKFLAANSGNTLADGCQLDDMIPEVHFCGPACQKGGMVSTMNFHPHLECTCFGVSEILLRDSPLRPAERATCLLLGWPERDGNFQLLVRECHDFSAGVQLGAPLHCPGQFRYITDIRNE